MQIETVKGFEVRFDRAYELSDHMWVEVVAPDRIRIGMDPLGIETAGTLAQLLFSEVGSIVARGGSMGSLEAEKFVGPLVTPVSGTITAVNTAAMADPSLVERDPFEAGWMIELAPSELAEDMARLTQTDESIRVEFEARVAEYRRDGVLAE